MTKEQTVYTVKQLKKMVTSIPVSCDSWEVTYANFEYGMNEMEINLKVPTRDE